MVTKKIEIDLNGDGSLDRITMSCSTDETYWESCAAVQVEMGLSDGRSVPVYKDEFGSAYTEGKGLVYSPQFYGDRALSEPDAARYFAEPGKVIGNYTTPVVSGQLTSDELIGLCYKVAPDETFHQCIEQAIHGPEGHIFQTRYGLTSDELIGLCHKDASGEMLNQCVEQAIYGPEGHIFQTTYGQPCGGPLPGGEICISDYGRAKARHVTSEDALAIPYNKLYSPFTIEGSKEKHKLRENVIMDAKAIRSENIAEYFYAYAEGGINDAFLAEVLAERWNDFILAEAAVNAKDIKPYELVEKLAVSHPRLLEKIVGNKIVQADAKELETMLDGATLDQKVLSMLGAWPQDGGVKGFVNSLQKSEILFRLLAKLFADKYPAEFTAWAILKFKQEESGYGRAHEPATMNHVMALAEAAINDPKHAGALLKVFLARYDIDNFNGPPPDGFIPVVSYVLIAAPPGGLPDAEIIIKYGERFAQLLPAVLIAVKKKNDRSPQVLAWIRKTIEGRLSPLARGASAGAALLLGDEARPYIEGLAQDQDEMVRLYTYQALAMADSPKPYVIEIFKKGANDSDPAVRFIASGKLIDWNIPEVASLLHKRLSRYREAKPQGLYPDTFREAALELAYDMNTPMVMGKPDKDNAYPTLKSLTLFAIFKFGQPGESAPMLETMLAEETSDEDLIFTAQALVSVKGAEGLKAVFDRIARSEVPDDLILFATGKAAELKEKSLSKRVLTCLFHPNEKVRKAVAQNLHAMGDERSLAAIIHHSRDAKPETRLRMAEALAYFDCSDSAGRLIELAQDQDEAVRKAAAASLRKLKDSNAVTIQFRLSF